MNFLRRLLAIWVGFFRKRATSPPYSLEPTTPLTRYIFSERHFNKAKNRVNPAAFLPPADNKLSVQDITNLDPGEIWSIGHKVGLVARRRLKARADFITEVVLASGLGVEVDEPPPGHRNIVGWSDIAEESEKESSDLLKAMQLADGSNLQLVP